jgi:Dolichyl-phosphate-mannose-protein mannosyltransferase
VIHARLGLGPLLLVALPLLKLFIHLAMGAGYGYHRDELYYLDCAEHLDWGYVDHPPLCVLVLAVTRALLGDSIQAIRIVPAVAGALTVLLVGLMTRRLGGRSFAQALAMTAVVVAPFNLALNAYFSMNAIDILVWALCARIFLEILLGGSERLWLVLGVVLGIGLENKISVLWLGGSLLAGLLLTPHRALLRTRGPWLAAAIAFLLFAPHVLWQVAHGWPLREFIRNVTEDKLVPLGPIPFLRAQVDGMLWVAAPVWMAGIAYTLFLAKGKGIRALGWAWLAVFALLAMSRSSRPVYLAPAYAWIIPAGGLAIEGWMSRFGAWPRVAIFGLLAFTGFLASAVVLPRLPVETLAAYPEARARDRRAEERTGSARVPEFLAHMCGWPEIVETVVGVYRQLPAEDRERVAILAPNYGVAGAIDRLGRPRGLPRALSGHNSYWLWGPQGARGDVLIVIGGGEARLNEWFAEVTHAADTHCDYCMSYESHRPVWVVRKPRQTLEALWPRLKFYL